jgi:hypothetical protein
VWSLWAIETDCPRSPALNPFDSNADYDPGTLVPFQPYLTRLHPKRQYGLTRPVILSPGWVVHVSTHRNELRRFRIEKLW